MRKANLEILNFFDLTSTTTSTTHVMMGGGRGKAVGEDSVCSAPWHCWTDGAGVGSGGWCEVVSGGVQGCAVVPCCQRNRNSKLKRW